MALVGHSMGTYPALWAVSNVPDIASARDGLELRTVITAGMMGNHIANVGRTAGAFAGSTPSDRVTAVVAGVLTTPTIRVDQRRIAVLDAASLADATIDLTPKGRALYEALALSPAPADLAGCGGLGARAALCNSTCAASVVASQFPTISTGSPARVRS